MDVGILSFGGYIPEKRLQRAAIARVHAWFNPGLAGLAKGERAIANWDEDSVTMAVEAARDCLRGLDVGEVSGVWMASTHFPFRDRQNAGILADALNLRDGFTTLDLSSSLRAGTSALKTALELAPRSPILVTAAEKRRAKCASPQEMIYGDGAATVLAGQGNVIARYLGGRTDAVDFVDHFRGEDSAFDYGWEERWIRDEGYLKIVPKTVSRLLADTGTDPATIVKFCFPAAAKRVGDMLAKKLGLRPEVVADNLQSVCGETGAAHPLVMLAKALEEAEPGDRILVTAFGQGCDALLFEATDALRDLPARTGIAGSLARRTEDENYARYVTHNDLLTIDRGIRSEVDKQTGLSTHYRNREMAQGMVGGVCRVCGTVQFPKFNVCVNPNCEAVGSQDDHPFADKTGRLNSFTADRLTYTPDPPAYYGMVQFEDGGRLMCDLTDIAPDQDLAVGMPVRMVFRVKDYDTRRDFRRYFWKAVPVDATGVTQETGREG